MDIEALHQLFLKHPNISTDSRNIPKDGIFFALKGPNFDGNRFALEALQKGAAWAVVDAKALESQSPRIILVNQVLKTLQQLATFHRKYCNTPVLALTGSNGKTTTKELLYAVLSKRFKTLATAGNLNNDIGVPLTLLRLTTDTELAVVEMGANHLGEIAQLCGIAQPDYGYITNFGKAHLEGFGGEAGVIKGKSEMYDYLISAGKTIFWNVDDPIQSQKLHHYPSKFGFSTKKQVGVQQITFLDANPYVCLGLEGTTVTTQLIGAYNFSNCAVAALAGLHFGIPVADIGQALSEYTPNNNRSQLLTKNGIQIILDAYNANPSSMTAALEHFKKVEAPTKIAILGDMFELGAAAQSEHLYIGKLAQNLNLQRLYLVGKNFESTGLSQAHYSDLEALKAELRTNPLPESAMVLIKGSRGMALERLLEVL
ncbi:MAG: hypothetical protein RLZZ241_560 [Bacteroidota bacterium]|jgi:UDP-N-acetylmuramoyl-tripeptide--D-alanyl-D-alanine ligase